MNITSLLKNKKDSKKNILESYNLKDEKLPL
jgi:DNA-directed RNA polymerase subunit H (RpoH/RPB5)